MSWRQETAQALRELAEQVEQGNVDALALVYRLSGGINAHIMHGSSETGNSEVVERMAANLKEWVDFPHIIQGEA